MGRICAPDSARVVVVDDVFEVELQRLFVRGRLRDPLGQLDNDRAESRGIEVNFLVVGHFADVALRKKG